jgi:hypothetical protein
MRRAAWTRWVATPTRKPSESPTLRPEPSRGIPGRPGRYPGLSWDGTLSHWTSVLVASTYQRS